MARSGPVSEGAEFSLGDVRNFQEVKKAIQPGIDGIINLVGIIREKPKLGITFENLHLVASENLLRVAIEKKVKRFIYVSALKANLSKTSYWRTKFEAEKLILNSGTAYTIFRPAIMFGDGDAFTNRLISLLKISPIFPIFGQGDFKIAPLAAENLAEAVVKSLTCKLAVNQLFEATGPVTYSWREYLKLLTKVVRRKTIFISIPISLVKILAKVFKGSAFPITEDELAMLTEGQTCDNWQKFFQTFQISPIYFEDYLAKIKA